MEGLQATMTMLQAMTAGAAACAGQRPAQQQPQPQPQPAQPGEGYVAEWAKYDRKVELKRHSKQNVLSIPQVLLSTSLSPGVQCGWLFY